MLNHIMIGASDIQKTKAFYDAVLGVLGAAPAMEHVNDTGHTRLFYSQDGATFSVSELSTASPSASPTARPLALCAARRSSYRSFTTWRLPMAVPPQRIRPEPAMATWV